MHSQAYPLNNCGGEDYEFGLRLLKADVSFVLADDAVGYHYEHETNNLDRVFVAGGCGWAGCGSQEIPGFARKLGDARRRWLRALVARLLVFAGVIDELKSRSAISSFMKGDPVRADLGDRENVGGAGESTNKVAWDC